MMLAGRPHPILRSRRNTQFIWPFNQMDVGDYADMPDSHRHFGDASSAMRRISAAAIRVGKRRGWRFSCHLFRNTTTIRCRRIL